MLCLVVGQAIAATTLLPNGKQCFTTATGAVVSGSLNMYVPNTTTPKATWQDAAQVTQNSQPIQLDANGCAIIYGTGIYRQQLYDGPVVAGVTTGNQVWDQATTDTSAFNSVFWAGVAGGSTNVITITDTGFNGTDGTVVNFVALFTNTSSVTLNPSSYGAISVVKDTTAGPVALTGGEITLGNVVSVVYYATSNTFHLLNTAVASASGTTAPLCGFSGLKITNNTGTPNSVINLTATQAVMQSAAGLVINRSNISITSLNITVGTSTSTANGMDGEATGSSAWLYVWLIDNGSASAGLVSAAAGNGLAPTLPSGYNYKCRAGAVRVDGSGNLLRTLQYGKTAQYVITAGTNTTDFQSIASGSNGSVPTASSVSSVVPATAASIRVQLSVPSSAIMATGPTIAVNSNLSMSTTSTGATAANLIGSFLLEATTVSYTSNVAGGVLKCVGWDDNL